MDIILWRHADAEEGIPDHARALTDKGKKQAQEMAKWLKSHLPEKDGMRILVSPALRTQQTADALGLPYEICDALASGREPDEVLSVTGWPNKQGSLIIVGHQPTLGQMAAFLLTGKLDDWSVKKAGIWWFHCSRNGGVQLEAVVSPHKMS